MTWNNISEVYGIKIGTEYVLSKHLPNEMALLLGLFLFCFSQAKGVRAWLPHKHSSVRNGGGI